jgi:D-alanyl-D-alanine carboxypeptidase/D-alanyl-D-alanine-endopeptidase (penicillin-binding protein 4)
VLRQWRNVLRRGAILAAVLAVAASSAQAAQAPLHLVLARALAVPHISSARSAALAVDLATGGAVFSKNERLPLAPASNEKLAITYAVLVELGPAFRIETAALGEGQQRGPLWDGDIVLKGYGDPTLASGGLKRLALQLRSAGIRRIAGSVVGDETFFDTHRVAPGWKYRFYMDESPPLSALSVDRGRYHGRVDAHPAYAAAVRFAEVLRATGIRVGRAIDVRGAAPTALPLARITSPPLAEIVRFMDHDSDNFTAELLLKQLGALATDHGSTAAGAAEVTHVLAAAGVPMDGVRIVDGSGLSRLDRLTANALVAILRVSWESQDVRPTLLAALPVAGMNGTLEDRLRRGPAYGVVRAKTGTTNQASALSGYVRGRYVFAVLQNGHPLPYWWARVAQDRFVTALASRH